MISSISLLGTQLVSQLNSQRKQKIKNDKTLILLILQKFKPQLIIEHTYKLNETSKNRKSSFSKALKKMRRCQ